MKNYKINFILPASCFLLLTSLSFAQYQCNWYSFSGGSGNIVSTNYQAQATAMQTAIGSLTSTNILAHIGFWQVGLMPGIMEQEKDENFDLKNLTTKIYSAKPNPFRTQTAIRYSLSGECQVSLFIYDASGRLVKNLVDEKIQPGIYTINWNGRNERGQKVSAGVYFYQFQTPNYSATKKLLLIE
jgi:hypothetical protein